MRPPGELAAAVLAWPDLDGWLADQYEAHGLTPDHFLNRMPAPVLWAMIPKRRPAAPQLDDVATLASGNRERAAAGLPPRAPDWFLPDLAPPAPGRSWRGPPAPVAPAGRVRRASPPLLLPSPAATPGGP